MKLAIQDHASVQFESQVNTALKTLFDLENILYVQYLLKNLLYKQLATRLLAFQEYFCPIFKQPQVLIVKIRICKLAKYSLAVNEVSCFVL